MISFKMNMPFHLMAFYGSIMIAAVLVLRGLLKNRLP
jgi:bla regulator protein BlaR1